MLRKICAYSSPKETRRATVYRNAEWQEYVVKFRANDQPLRDADYHTDDKADAIGTAINWTQAKQMPVTHSTEKEQRT